MAYSKTVVVFGSTGAIGTSLIEIMSKNEPTWQIRAVSRSNDSSKSRLATLGLPNVQLVQGDVEDLDSAKEVSRGTDLVFSCVGFARYEKKYWCEHWPIVMNNLLAITSTERPLIFCDNLYAYGNPKDEIIHPETTSIIPESTDSKPGVRAWLRRRMQERMDESPGSVVAVGASDFFGPHVTDDRSVLGGMLIGNMVKGQGPMCLVSSRIRHDFCYGPDLGNALYVVAKDENRTKSMGRFWICPTTLQNKTYEEMRDMVNDQLDTKVTKGFQVIPYWLVYGMGFVSSLMYEMTEMMHLWREDYRVDASDFERQFGVTATPADKAIAATIASLKA